MLETPRCQSLTAPVRHAHLSSTQKGERETKLGVLAKPGEDLGGKTEVSLCSAKIPGCLCFHRL